MKKQNPFDIVKTFYVTEKSKVLGSLKNSESNRSISLFKQPKYVFLVDPRANKHEIKEAVEEIYKAQAVKVTKVNTIHVKAKPCRFRGRPGAKSSFKKAIVTLESKDNLEDFS